MNADADNNALQAIFYQQLTPLVIYHASIINVLSLYKVLPKGLITLFYEYFAGLIQITLNWPLNDQGPMRFNTVSHLSQLYTITRRSDHPKPVDVTNNSIGTSSPWDLSRVNINKQALCNAISFDARVF